MKNPSIFLVCFITSLAFITACQVPQEETLTLSKGEIDNEYHNNNIGSIAFMDTYTSLRNFSPNDNLPRVTIKESGEFYGRIHPEFSQTYYLSQLAPELSPNDLCKNGNWSVKFYLDDQFIYQDDVNPGAGSCQYRNQNVAVVVPFLTNFEDSQDHWGAFLWLRFTKKEKKEKLFETGIHKLTLEFIPYIKYQGKKKYGEVVAKGSVNITRKEIETTEADLAIQPIAPIEDWNIAEQNYDKKYLREINKKVAQRKYKKLSSIVVIKDGELLVEEYFNGANRNSLHDTRSVGKTFASTMLGIAIEEGHIKDVNQALAEYYDLKKFDNYDSAKESISLEELLSMNAPFKGNDSDYDSPGNEENMYPTEDWVKFTLDLPIDKSKTEKDRWEYFTAGCLILGDVIDKAVPSTLVDYTSEKLFNPLGVKNFKWQYTPTGVGNTAGGLQLTSLGYAKYGQLYKNGGHWEGKQIFPKAWAEKSLSKVINRSDKPTENYGYLFWNDVFTHNGKSYEAAYCSGNGGNKVLIFKDIPVVIVITCTAYGTAWGHAQAKEMVEDYLLGMVID